ncbi:MAG: tRNA (adenosine(37)-N6)-threonylcarbamoyltransferase complex ATPase subunit type 1 TsaE [Candidatus Portnoybacteria bacterium RIFCSPLOWO2_01_FULL_43_11]|uniref:tRNA threonylcarbamoyladenosine biosynthesis protein TsaE n=4 Tax=Candidatus Portnoyibacteriota TaxID=1817913 RepID=A0A1G2FD99_9BACT|nr:MAG: tRNA (adenosine(37)-N6)-threonylcarbamoyltransferase complex ATPase subunit type 1 TsaE [Candidatus Portnoybacteria bacterium RIFCSPHIGHO2_01_FULL_40_12b]OGZ37444.1 MAG: tRNA (adenosine(37)-N6)-threonylcarbamoyltransferase complex ATPase subunit type 1 TsaE [Candidatus Portnoybacteria bacterium RIFCSPHIGHO2_02_FULL_40_23]OGZ37972.1 MAG: tRNA (adenosine(37)-N6)-threonylcarbamoyltransferase complex ATPase subunit type 1 TsaE [Candidatus Portnoybacteria bacterium RIFCSPHIGHO2_12_FULL_40_11]
MNDLEIITENEKETQKAGKFLAEELFKKTSRKKAAVIALKGELGSGKTAFVKGMAQGFGVKEKIISPTFVVLKKYGIKNINFYHIDCYRLVGPKDLIDLDFKEIINDSENIIAVEWAERVREILPGNSLWVKFEHWGKNKRKIII